MADGTKVVARGLPCGWINPEAQLVIGPGAVVDWQLLLREIDAAEAIAGRDSIRRRLHIHPAANIVTDAQHRAEGGVGGYAHDRIGSTGEGVGMCRIARVSRQSLLRGAEFATVQARDVDALADMVREFHYTTVDRVLLEGTQGSMLSLIHGPWPHVTSADTNAGQLLVDAGLSPGYFEQAILVARAFPIRVAGRSGPLPNETTWEAIGQPEERTTVTQKVRRVGLWDLGWVQQAIRLNQPCEVVITFLDYMYPETKEVQQWEDLSAAALSWVAAREYEMGVPVVGVGTGPRTIAWRKGFLG